MPTPTSPRGANPDIATHPLEQQPPTQPTQRQNPAAPGRPYPTRPPAHPEPGCAAGGAVTQPWSPSYPLTRSRSGRRQARDATGPSGCPPPAAVRVATGTPGLDAIGDGRRGVLVDDPQCPPVGGAFDAVTADLGPDLIEAAELLGQQLQARPRHELPPAVDRFHQLPRREGFQRLILSNAEVSGGVSRS